MSKYITKIRTEDGDLQIDYNALANKPTASDIGAVPSGGGTISGDLFVGNLDNTSQNDIYIRRLVEDAQKSARLTWRSDGNFRVQGASDNDVFNHMTLSPDKTSFFKPVDIASGGTGATTAADALKNLGITATAAELNKMDGVTATTTELNYVDGVTSNIQTQINDVKTQIDDAILNHTHSSLKDVSGGSVGVSFYASASAPGMGGSGEAGYCLAPSHDDNSDYYLGSPASHWDRAYIDDLRLPNALPIAMGGTGAITAAAALANLGGIEIVDANSSSYDMDEIIASGAHFRFYSTNGDTLGTPKAYGATSFLRALILSYSTGSNYGAQFAMSAGGHMYHRRRNNGNLGPWRRITTQQLISGTDYGNNFPEGYTHSENTRGTIFYKKVGG